MALSTVIHRYNIDDLTRDLIEVGDGGASVLAAGSTAAVVAAIQADLDLLYAPISVVPTYVQPGVNITTGGTITRPIVHVAGSPVFTAVTASSISGTSVSATTFFSGSTNLNYLLGQSSTPVTYVQPGLNITTGGTASAPIVNLAGTVVLTGLTFSSTLGDTSANFATGVYFKNASNAVTSTNRFLYDSTLGQLQLTLASVSSGVYVTTGGLTGATVFGTTSVRSPSVSGTSVSATTFYSGSTDVSYLLGNGGPGSSTYVQPGLNVYTGGTISSPIVGLIGEISLTSVTVSSHVRDNGATTAGAVYFKHPSSGHITNHNRFLYDSNLGLVSFTTGNPTDGAYTSTGGFTGATLQGSTIRSGSTELSAVFNSSYAPISVVATYVQNGNQITTGGTATRPTVNLASSPAVNNLIASGVSYGATVSGATIYEGSTLLSSKYAPKDLTVTLSGSTYILNLNDDSRLVDMSGASAQNLVVPRNSAVAFPIGSQVMVAQTGAGQVSFSADTGVSILSYNSQLKLTGLYATASLVKKDTNTWLLGGNLTT